MTRIRTTLALALGMAVALPALSTVAAPVVEATAKLTAKVEITDEEAQQDDILLVIDLPILIAEAKDAGVAEVELTAIVTTAAEAELSAGDAAEVVVAETEHTKANGKRTGLGAFVKLQLAEGVRGKELAAKIREHKAEIADLTPEQKAKYDEKLAVLREQNKARKLALAEKRKELRGKGTEIKLVAKDLHDARKAELKARKDELEQARRERHQAKKEHHDASDEAHEANAERKEAREELEDAKDDLKAADTPEDKKEAREDKKEAREDLKDAKADARDAKKDVKDAKKDVKDAKKDVGDAKKDNAKDKKGG
jgi:chromosome segregation ATPase